MTHGSGSQAHYRIKVEGCISPEWSAWLNGLAISLESELTPITVIDGMVVDQAHLRGLLNKLWDLNLNLVSLERIDPYGGNP